MRKSILILVAMGAARNAGALPEEVRVGSLGARGVVFRDEDPGIITEHLSAAGDTNGDGLADILLTRWDMSLDLEGQVHLVFGAPDLPAAPDLAQLTSISTVFKRSGPRFGRSDLIWGSAPAGDADADGLDDFLIFRPSGAPAGWPDGEVTPGLVYLVQGSAAFPRDVDLDAPPAGVRIATLTSSRPVRTSLGLAAAHGGDVNGDGVPDLALAAFSQRVYVLFGGTRLTGTVDVEETGERRPGFIIEGTVEGELLGSSLAFTGDANGDGFGDLLAGAPNTIGRFAGSAYLVLGTADFPPFAVVDDLLNGGRAFRFEGQGGLAHAGNAVAAPGDLNGDGLADFIIGAPGASNQTGEVYLVFGRPDFPASTLLPGIAGQGGGVTFRGQSLPSGQPVPLDARAGETLAILDDDGDGRPDIFIGSPEYEHRGIEDVGRGYIVRGAALAEGVRLLGEIESGALPGSVFTSEVRERLASTATAPGDVNGDGHEDLLLSADPTAAGWAGVASAYLVYGTGGGPGPLAIEALSPPSAPLAGGVEIAISGAGFDAGTAVEVAGRPVAVKRLETSARLVFDAPVSSVLGPVDVTVTRGAATATLPGGLLYVPRFHADIEAGDLAASGRGTAVRGAREPFALADLDGDGFADLITAERSGLGVFIVHGGPRPPAEIALPDPGGPVAAEGVSLVRVASGSIASPARLGDVNGDGREDLAVVSQGLIHVLFGGERFPEDVEASDFVAQGRGAAVHYSGSRPPDVAGGGDFDGDGLGDIAAGQLDDSGEAGTVRLLRGRRDWPGELFLEDARTWLSDEPEDHFGEHVALAGDMNGDGRSEILIGAPGRFWSDDGNGYLIPGAPGGGDETIQSLLARGAAVRIDAFKPRDSLGSDVCSPGDFNGDGIPDLALGAEGGGIEFAGESYVVFGGPALAGRPAGSPLDLTDLGDAGVRITGDHSNDYAFHVVPAGDFDGDGLADLLVGANAPSTNPRAYVIFGGPARTVSLRYLSGGGVRINGPFRVVVGIAGGGDFNGDGFSDVAVGGYAGPGAEPVAFLVLGQGAERAFIRGDTNGDLKLDISDPVAVLEHLFLGAEDLRCDDAGDGNDDGLLDITDAIYVLGHLFLGGTSPPPPFPERGRDATADALECEAET